MNTIYNKVRSLALKTIKRLPLWGLGGFCLLVSSCNDWTDVKPEGKQVTDDYWKSKEDVEAVLSASYYTLREAVPTLIKWGEYRGGSMYTLSTTTDDQELQNFNMTSTNSLCSYSTLYKVIGYANSVLQYAPQVSANDDTYQDAIYKSHLTEAYFLRALCYLYLVKNYKEVPLITQAYVDDGQSFNIAKSSEDEIIAQIKSDYNTAMATNAAKVSYETEWQSKGRATKWALDALMADVDLWSGDYQDCIKKCDEIINASDAFAPRLYTNSNDWFKIFCPNSLDDPDVICSNEGIFELVWNYATDQKNNNFTSLFPTTASSGIQFTEQALIKMQNEQASTGGTTGRMAYTSSMPSTIYEVGTSKVLGKYRLTQLGVERGSTETDANFIVYRMAEIYLMRAQAYAMLGDMEKAGESVNVIRKRAGLAEISSDELVTYTKQTMIEEILLQKEMEFMGEGKRWYDVLWYARAGYKNDAINIILTGNTTIKPAFLKSVLADDYAWYLPLPDNDIQYNQLLVQNPYYGE